MLCAYSLSHVWIFATPRTVARQAALSMGILQARILSVLLCPPPGQHNLKSPQKWKREAESYNVWQNPLQCCEVISLQLIKINEKKNEREKQKRSKKRNMRCIWPILGIKKSQTFSIQKLMSSNLEIFLLLFLW